MFKKVTLIAFTVMLFFAASNFCAPAKDIFSKEQSKITNDSQTAADKLSLINKYQERYFEIYKEKIDTMALADADDSINKVEKKLKKLFKEAEKQISDKKSLKEYKKADKQIGKCDGITMPEINECAQRDYNLADNLLNDVYKKVELKTNSNDFKNISASQKKWLKDLENFEKANSSTDFGLLGTTIHYESQTDAREFRTLLLMMYL